MSKIGILGSGDVAKALARGFLSRGHEVKLGTRDATKLADFAKETKATVGTFADAAGFGEVVVLATLGSATLVVLDLAGKQSFAGKVVIDTTNPLAFAPNSPPTLFVSGTDSLGEQVQRALPDAKVVKAFNTVGNADMVDPKVPGGPPDLFLAGNDAAARKQVGELATSFGNGVVDLGSISAARYTEGMCIAWVLVGIVGGKWGHAFKLLRK